jgi:hypothetical protein
MLKLEPSFSAISLEQAKRLFSQLRDGSSGPPYRMPESKQRFIRDFMSYAASSDPEATSILENKLAQIWDEFHEEYEWVSINDVDARCSRFVIIEEGR